MADTARRLAKRHRRNGERLALYLSLLENNTRDPTLSVVTRIAEALRVPVGVLFVLAAADDDLGGIGGNVVEHPVQSALTPPGDGGDITVRRGNIYG